MELPRWDPRAITRTRAILQELRPAVVHTHLKHADLVGGIAGRALGLPVVSTLHVVEDVPDGWIATHKRTAGLVVRRRTAARTIALSARQRQWYEDLVGNDDGLVILPNGVADPAPVDADARQRLRTELGAVDGRPLIASASLMRPEKGHDLLLDAVALLDGGVRPSWSPWRATVSYGPHWRPASPQTPCCATESASWATGRTSPRCSERPTWWHTPAWPTHSPPP